VRSLARLVLVLGLVAAGVFLFGGSPRDVTLVYALPDPASVSTLEVEVLRDDAALRHVEFRFPAGAPPQVRHEVRLPDGDYRLALRIAGAPGGPRRVSLPLTVSGSGPVVLAVPSEGPSIH
jgi:hypothetical protein